MKLLCNFKNSTFKLSNMHYLSVGIGLAKLKKLSLTTQR